MNDVGTTILHQNHIQNSKHINVWQLLNTQKLLHLDLANLAFTLRITINLILSICNHQMHGRDKETCRTCGKVPNVAIFVDSAKACHEFCYKARCKHHIVFCAIRHIYPFVQDVEQSASKVKIVHFTINERHDVAFHITVKSFQLAFAIDRTL